MKEGEYCTLLPLRHDALDEYISLSGDPAEMLQEYADMVCLGTVADVIPLVGENRIYVKRGLEALNSHPRPGLAALWFWIYWKKKASTKSGLYWKRNSRTSGFLSTPRALENSAPITRPLLKKTAA